MQIYTILATVSLLLISAQSLPAHLPSVPAPQKNIKNNHQHASISHLLPEHFNKDIWSLVLAYCGPSAISPKMWAAGLRLKPTNEKYFDALSADGSKAATIQAYQAIIWNIKGRTSILCILDKKPCNFIHSILFSPDNNRVLTTTSDGSAQIWDVPSGKELFELRHASPNDDEDDDDEEKINNAVFTPDGKSIITASAQSIQFWDAQTGKHQGILHHNGAPKGYMSLCSAPNPSWCVSTNKSGSKIITGSTQGTISVWETTSKKKILHLSKGHNNSIDSAQLSEDESLIISTCINGKVCIWNAEDGTLLGSFGSATEPCHANISHDNTKLLIKTKHTLILWNLINGKELMALKNNDICIDATRIESNNTIIQIKSLSENQKKYLLESTFDQETMIKPEQAMFFWLLEEYYDYKQHNKTFSEKVSSLFSADPIMITLHNMAAKYGLSKKELDEIYTSFNPSTRRLITKTYGLEDAPKIPSIVTQ